jgi:O-glycosyl hydrolase
MKNIILSIMAVIILTTCSTSGGGGSEAQEAPQASLNVHYNEVRQEIDGFGGSDAWLRMPRYPEEAEELVKLLFSRTEGVGFTILRNSLPFRERLPGDNTPSHNDGFVVRKSDHTYDYTVNPDGTKTFNLNWNGWDMSDTRTLIQYIQALGDDGPEKLVIKSTPWTPPNNRVTRWKEDANSPIDWSKPDVWGRLRRDKYEDYADLLADYVLNFEEKMGAPLSILSVQNEPNWKTDYESCYWSGTDLRDFIKVIGQRFPMKGITLGEGGLGIMAPEFENFDVNFNTMIKPMLDDPESNRVLTHIGLHQYNANFDSSNRAGAKEFPGIIQSGKPFWQTEISGFGMNVADKAGINNAIYYARMIHFDMTLTQVNAFLYWWLWSNDVKEDGFPGCLINIEGGDMINPAKRLYAMGQYSRFIRPGWRRIDADTQVRTGVYSSAYRSMESNEVAIVIVNDRSSRYTVSVDLSDVEFDNLEIWRTSASENLAALGKQATNGSSAIVTLQPKSITTLYGRVK